MKKILMLFVMIGMVCCSAFAQNGRTDSAENGKVLVAYFSATGTTARVAKNLATLSKGDVYEIVPVKPYTSADLNWNNKQSRTSVEMKNPKVRPALKGKKENLNNYDVVFIGYPIWWNLAPRIINTFIESHDLKGKRLIPFATSGGSSIDNSVNVLKKTYPDLKWEKGRLLNGANERMLQQWINEIE